MIEARSWRTPCAFSCLALACAIAGLTAVGCGQAAPSGGEDPSGGGGDVASGVSGDNTAAAGTSQNAAGSLVSGSGGSGGHANGGGSSGAGGGLAAGGSAGSNGSAGSSVIGVDTGHIARTGPLRIMAMGDSITTSTCFRAKLALLLDMKHKGDYDFVGTQKGGCDSIKYDTDNEGHGGYLITQHTGEFAGWATANKIDVMLLHFATNDNWNSLAPAKILAAYTTLVTEFRKQSPNAVILAAQLIPLAPAGCDPCQGNVKTFNAAIPAWAQMTSTAMSPVIVVDQWTGYDAIADNRDGVHPNDDGGSVKMAKKWDEALEPLF